MSTAGRPRSRVARPRVVIAAADPPMRRDLARTLAEEGFDVVDQVGAGQPVAALVAEHRPDLVIMDIETPGAAGKRAATEVATVAARTAPVIILTAFPGRELIHQALAAGAVTYLVRPFSTATLLLAIDSAAALSADGAALRADVGEPTERRRARAVIDRATGLLMTRGRMTGPQAFRWLQRTAMNRRTSMYAVAKDVIERPQPSAGSSPCRHRARARRQDDAARARRRDEI